MIWNRNFPLQAMHTHLESSFSFKTPPYLEMHFKKIAFAFTSTSSKVSKIGI